MRYLVSEKKLGFAVLFLALGIFLASKALLFTRPVLVAEKGLLLLLVAFGFIVSSVYFVVRSIRKV